MRGIEGLFREGKHRFESQADLDLESFVILGAMYVTIYHTGRNVCDYIS